MERKDGTYYYGSSSSSSENRNRAGTSHERTRDQVKEQKHKLEAKKIPKKEAASLATKIVHSIAEPPADVTALIEVATVIKNGELSFGIDDIRVGVKKTFSHIETLLCSFYSDDYFYGEVDMALVHKFYKVIKNLIKKFYN